MKCAVPFTAMYIHADSFSTCCPAWQDSTVICKRVVPDPWGVWNSEEFRALRRAWLAGNGKYCTKCPIYQTNDSAWIVDSPHLTNDLLTRGPEILYVSDDDACNMNCWTCREKIVGRHTNTEQKEKFLRTMFEAFLPAAEWLSLLHSGEIFMSDYHMRLLNEITATRCPNLSIDIFTNGMLLPRKWADLRPVHPLIKQITMSIDAATKETYERVRTPARWEQLIAALEFVKSLRDNGLPSFQCNFVVRKVNYREILPFVDMCLAYGATFVRFTTFAKSWMTEDEYLAEVPYNQPDFAEIVNDPRLDRDGVYTAILRQTAAGKKMMP